jgi:hypothetical protein
MSWDWFAIPTSGMQPQGDQLQERMVGHASRARAAGPSEFRLMGPKHEALVNEMLEDCRQMMRRMDITPRRPVRNSSKRSRNDLQHGRARSLSAMKTW